MSSYDEYYETDDPWERHQQRMELDAHLARCREEETKRSASMARAGELVQHGSVADALLPALVRHLATLRALACTCRAWRAKVREHFASLAQLQLYRHDVSESNAAFVYGPLLEHRPDIHVIFVREDDDGKVKESIAMRGLKKWVDGRRKSGKWVLSTFGAGDLPLFFCSRAVAKMPELRLLLPREDESKGPISFTCGDLSSLRFAWSDPNLGGCGKFKMVQHKLARCAFNMVAGCHLVAALEALTEPAWLEKADLDLSYLHLDDEGARTLALKMRKNAPPKSIRLAHTMSRDGSLGMLGVLGKRTEELILYKNNLGNHGLDYLQENARTMPKLRYLNIGHNYVDERVQLNFLNWVAREAEWPRIERIDMFYDPNPPLIRLVLKTCDMARARCEWSELLNRESRWMDDPEASDYDVPQGHTTEESSSSDESVSVSDEEEESDSDDEEEDHDE